MSEDIILKLIEVSPTLAILVFFGIKLDNHVGTLLSNQMMIMNRILDLLTKDDDV